MVDANNVTDTALGAPGDASAPLSKKELKMMRRVSKALRKEARRDEHIREIVRDELSRQRT